MKVNLYVEGAETDLQRSECRLAFKVFFEAAGLKGKLPHTVPCGGRGFAYKAFKIAMQTRKPNELPLLLVDSEGPIAQGHTAWQHLKTRPGDGWDRPNGATEDQAFLMVQVMETWFIADQDALRDFFGNCFNDNKTAWPNLEAVPRQGIYDALDRATATCGKKHYVEGTKGDFHSNCSPLFHLKR